MRLTMGRHKNFASEGGIGGSGMNRAERRRQARIKKKSEIKNTSTTISCGAGSRVSLDIMTAQATQYLESGAYKPALAVIDNILRIDPDHAEALAQRGTLHYLHGDFRAAIQLYRRAAKIDKRNPNILYNLGLALSDDGQRLAAVAPLQKAVALNPRFGEAHNALGFALMAGWKFEEATQYLSAALECLGPDVLVYTNLGICHAMQGDTETAIAFYAKALQLEPQAHRVVDAIKFTISGLVLSGEKRAQQEWAVLRKSLQEAFPQQLALIENDLERLKVDPADGLLNKAQTVLPALEEDVIEFGGPQAVTGAEDRARLPERTCALLHFGRSATGLLHALVDSHPQVTTLPGVYFKGFFGRGVWERIRSRDPQTLIDRFSDIYEVLFNAASPKTVPGYASGRSAGLGRQEGLTRLGENQDKIIKLNKSAFQQHLRELLSGRDSLSQGEFFLILHRAFERAQGKTANENLVFYHIHNPDIYEFTNFLRYFPSTTLLMMAREPIQNCESWIAGDVVEAPNYPSFIFKLTQLLTDIVRPEFQGRDAVGVKLDDLKRKPEATTRALAARLGIDWDTCLLEPTMQGLAWWGDPSSKTFGLDPFDTAVLKREVGAVFGAGDQRLLRALYYPFRVLYGWEQADDSEFRALLAEAPKILEQPLDCEKLLLNNAGLPLDRLKHHTSYKYLRLVLGQRLKTLEKYGTYPGMIPPLEIGT